MMPSPDIFPVPLIHINETNSTNNYLQSLCSEQKVEELTVVIAAFHVCGHSCQGMTHVEAHFAVVRSVGQVHRRWDRDK